MMCETAYYFTGPETFFWTLHPKWAPSRWFCYWIWPNYWFPALIPDPSPLSWRFVSPQQRRPATSAKGEFSNFPLPCWPASVIATHTPNHWNCMKWHQIVIDLNIYNWDIWWNQMKFLYCNWDPPVFLPEFSSAHWHWSGCCWENLAQRFGSSVARTNGAELVMLINCWVLGETP